jgi:hypothetical protein
MNPGARFPMCVRIGMWEQSLQDLFCWLSTKLCFPLYLFKVCTPLPTFLLITLQMFLTSRLEKEFAYKIGE